MIIIAQVLVEVPDKDSCTGCAFVIGSNDNCGLFNTKLLIQDGFHKKVPECLNSDKLKYIPKKY